MLSHWAVLAVVLGLDAYGGLGLDSADVLELLAKSPESSGCGEADHRAGQRRSQASPPPPRRRQDRGDPGRATPPADAAGPGHGSLRRGRAGAGRGHRHREPADCYQRAVACEDARPGSRNGYREVTVKTTAGPVHLSRLKLRGTTKAFASRLFGSHVTRTSALETLVIALLVLPVRSRRRGGPGRGAGRPGRAISKSAVSSICGQIKDEYAAWAWRGLDGSRWTTYSWTPRSSGCTPAPRPSRCWPPGASPPRLAGTASRHG